MIYRIEVSHKKVDPQSVHKLKYLHGLGYPQVDYLTALDVYTVDMGLSDDQAEQVGDLLINPVNQQFFIKTSAGKSLRNGIDKPFTWALEIGFLPGVTDNVGHTVAEMIGSYLNGEHRDGTGVYSSRLWLLAGDISYEMVVKIAGELHNPLIQRIHVKSYDQFVKEGGMNVIMPQVKMSGVSRINLDLSDEELMVIGKQGIANGEPTRRGPLALSLVQMKAIAAHFKQLGRQPTDVELESLAQTWSEHCKHTIFADPMDELADGLFKTYIKAATERVRREKGNQDNCISVFTDNSGSIDFDEDYMVSHKVETHNSPSALDPFGGAITGIVGVNRDAIGFGLGAKPVINTYGFCFADPVSEPGLYRDAGLQQPLLSPRRIMEGVIAGVNAGGNCSGIPTPQGFTYFDPSYGGKPLVFVGTVGLLPKKIQDRDATFKQAMPGDLIVVVGGKVGKDGIHGATFSSEALDSGSPVGAVQIGDPITQKKLSDALVKEARDQLLYTSITDNGAGGLSCSVAEMAKECNGSRVDMDKVPLKYAGLKPWEIWISESQERMTLAVPPENWEKFSRLMRQRGVDAWVIGEFTDTGRCEVYSGGEKVVDLDLEFLHHGLPQSHLKTSYQKPAVSVSKFDQLNDLNLMFEKMLGRLNTADFSFISSQYDYEVQGGSVLKPLQGKGLVQGDTTVVRPVLNSAKGVAISQGLWPSLSNLDPYQMAASAIDTAVRNLVAVGIPIETIALLDNFCWCSSNDPARLGQLKLAAQACFDYAVAYKTPYISGKDSMFNDFKGFDRDGQPVQISVLPTLLISAIGVIDDVLNVVSMDVKSAGDLIYILGETREELGGSEYLRMLNEDEKEFSGKIPAVDSAKNLAAYRAFNKAVKHGLVASSISVGRGGLGVAMAKTAMAGKLGLTVDLKELPGSWKRADTALYNESQGRLVVTIAPQKKTEFEKLMKDLACVYVGVVSDKKKIVIKDSKGKVIVQTTINACLKSYRSRFAGY